jgi:hypothetical protein
VPPSRAPARIRRRAPVHDIDADRCRVEPDRWRLSRRHTWVPGFRARQGGWRRRQRRSIGEECRSPAIVRGGFRISSAAGARRGPGVGRSHWAEIERSQRGALSAPFPSPPAGPAPWFWRQGGGLRFAARHPLLLARAGKVAQIGSAAVTIAEAELGIFRPPRRDSLASCRFPKRTKATSRSRHASNQGT